MTNSRDTPIFSDALFGPGVGLPTSGPFRGWRQANPNTVFTRNAGNGQLFTNEGIRNIISRTRNREILLPTALGASNLEGQHGGAHVFVGGSMNNLNEAARDPLFFSHHAYVDKIWEDFRLRQRTLGINPEQDYPFDQNDPRFRPEHNPNSRMGFFPNRELNIDFLQITGYTNAFFQLVQYEDVSCPACGNSPYLFCDGSQNPARCVSRSRFELRRTGAAPLDSDPGVTATGRARRAPTEPSYQYGQDGVCPRANYLVNDFNVNTMMASPSGPQDDVWCYIPFKVISKRPAEYNGFQKYDMYEMPHTDNGYKNIFYEPGNNKGYKSCEKRIGDVGKIKVVSYGSDHYSYAEEYVLVDNRYGVSEATGALPVRKQYGSTPSQSIVAAFDECGRVCKPYCKHRSTERHNQYFSGAISINNLTPIQHAPSYGDAMLEAWDIPGPNDCPILNDLNVPITFFCENTDPWIWGPQPSSPVVTQQQRGPPPQSISLGSAHMSPVITSGPGTPIGAALPGGIFKRPTRHRIAGRGRSRNPGKLVAFKMSRQIKQERLLHFVICNLIYYALS